MGSLALSLTGVASNWLVPQQLIEVALAQGAVMGAAGTPRILLMGVKTTAGSGTATPDTTVYGPLSVERDVVTYFGNKGNHHLMWREIAAKCPNALIYGIAVTEGAGVAATNTIVLGAGPATANGTLNYSICGQQFSCAISNGDTVTVAGDALALQINSAFLPVIAVNTAGSVAITYRCKGTNGNFVRYHGTLTGATAMTATFTAGTLASGATDEVYTTALATIAADQYDYIVPAINPTTTADARFLAISNALATQVLPTSGIRQQAIMCSAASLANATTLVTTYNKFHNQVLWQKNSEQEPCLIAAQWAGIRYMSETGGSPHASYDNYGSIPTDNWTVPCQYLQSDFPSAVDVNTALSVGLTPIAAMKGGTGKSYVVMSCTAQGADPRIRDTAKVTVTYRFAADLAARDASIYPRAHVSDDPPVGAKPPPPDVCTPQREQANVINPLLYLYRDNGWLTDVDTAVTGSVAATVVGIDPVVVTRINARIPLKVTAIRHQFCALVSEVSSG
jgi:phage tail sheath gpL-like